MNAWICVHQGDLESERRELERLLAANPADMTALDRLAQCEEKDGKKVHAGELVRKKAEIERLRARFEKLFDREQPVRDAEEIARLAEQLGRGFEARAFLILALSEEPDREDLRRDLSRLSQSSATVGEHGQTLAQVAVE